jgi:MFS family permease
VAIPLDLGGAAFVAGMNAITQQECPPEMRGRVLALGAIAFLGSTPIGGPITGWIGDNVGAEWALAYGGLITLVTMGVWWIWSVAQRPDLRSASALWGLRPQPAMAPPASVEHP